GHQNGEERRSANQPVSGVPAPSAESILQPKQRKHRKKPAHQLMKQLLQCQPKAAKTATGRRLGRNRLSRSGHAFILAQVAKLYESAVNQLETTHSPRLVSNWTES